MTEEKQVTKKDIQELLNGQTKAILDVVDKKIDDKIDGLAVIMQDSFQTNQEYMDKRFTEVHEKMDTNFKQIKENFTEVKRQIDNLSRNIVDVVHQEQFDKLETRVVDVEEVLDLKLKRA